jgi:MtaA/CmuA family methyltransferase
MNKRERVLAHIDGKPVDQLPCMPITMMFAADHNSVGYHVYATHAPSLAESQIRVSDDFGFDHVSVISDPAVEAADLGASVIFFESQPPALNDTKSLLREKTVLLKLPILDPDDGRRMSNRIDAVRRLKNAVGNDVLVEGWVEGPCAESADLRGISDLMTDFFDDPAFVHDLFAYTRDNAIRFAREQLKAGADIIGIGDAVASLVGPRIYKDFVQPYETELVNAIHGMGGLVRLHICGRTQPLAADIGTINCEIVDVDYPNPLADFRASAGPERILLGNIDPVRDLRDRKAIAVSKLLAQCHKDAGPRYIVGAGCEVPRDTTQANVRALSSYARGHQPTDIDLEYGL